MTLYKLVWSCMVLHVAFKLFPQFGLRCPMERVKKVMDFFNNLPLSLLFSLYSLRYPCTAWNFKLPRSSRFYFAIKPCPVRKFKVPRSPRFYLNIKPWPVRNFKVPDWSRFYFAIKPWTAWKFKVPDWSGFYVDNWFVLSTGRSPSHYYNAIIPSKDFKWPHFHIR